MTAPPPPINAASLFRNIAEILDEIAIYCGEVQLPDTHMRFPSQGAGSPLWRAGQNMDRAEQYLTDLAILHRQLSEFMKNNLVSSDQVSDLDKHMRLLSLKNRLFGEIANAEGQSAKTTIELF